MTSVSIIIPTHNRADWLPEAIASAKSASTKGAEIIVVDDASSDRTPEICRGISGIRYLRLDKNLGLAGARNVGIGASGGEYLAFLDDDDRRLPGSLDAQLSLLESDPNLTFVYGPVMLGNWRDGKPTGNVIPERLVTGDVFWQLLENNFVRVPSVVARKRLVEEVGLFDRTLTCVEDWLMWIRLAERGKVGAVTEPVAIYREPNRESDQMTSNTIAMCRYGALVQSIGLSLPRAFEDPMKRREVRRCYLDGLSWSLVHESVASFAEGNYSAALTTYATAVRLNPRRALRPYTLKLLRAKLSEKKAAD